MFKQFLDLKLSGPAVTSYFMKGVIQDKVKNLKMLRVIEENVVIAEDTVLITLLLTCNLQIGSIQIQS